jgi:uncharacterized protein HemX
MAKKIKQIEMKMPREPRKIVVKKPKEKMSEKIVKKTKSLADIITAVGIIGAALLGVGGWLVSQANAGMNNKLDTIIAKVDSAEENATRSQLLTLMSDYPNNESEILKVAQYYFQDLKGDWYMTGLFTKWAESRGLDVSEIVSINGK